MNKAETTHNFNIDVEGQKLLVCAKAVNDEQWEVGEIFEIGGRDSRIFYNPRCYDAPWCFEGRHWPTDKNERMRIRNDATQKIQKVLGNNAIFPNIPERNRQLGVEYFNKHGKVEWLE